MPIHSTQSGPTGTTGLFLTGANRFGERPSSAAVIASIRSLGFLPAGRKDVEPIPFSLPFDWSMNPYNDPNWQTQLHAWRIMDPLILAHENDGRAESLTFALEIADDWLRWILSKKKRLGRAWYDLSTGLRAAKLAYFRMTLNHAVHSASLIETIDALIEIHLKNLLDDHNFNRGNHGIFQANGLKALSRAIPNSHPLATPASDKADQMLKLLVDTQFDDQGIHREGSVEYHFFALERFTELLAAPWWKDVPLQILREKLVRAEENGNWLCLPNGQDMTIGDSSGKLHSIPLRHKTPTGVNIEHISFNKGYNIARKINSSLDKSWQLFFRTGFDIPVHSHNDIFNIIFWMSGKYLLADPGKYGYKKDPARQYVLSESAHNGLYAEPEKKDTDQIYPTKNYLCLSAVDSHALVWSAVRSDGPITYGRTIVLVPNTGMIVRDKAKARGTKTYHLNWTLGSGWTALDGPNPASRFSFKDEADRRFSLTFFDRYLRPKDFSLVSGRIAPNMLGWISGSTYKTLVPTQCAHIVETTKEYEGYTLFSFTTSPSRLRLFSTPSGPEARLETEGQRDKTLLLFESDESH